jgi:membrane protease YdiL (CAAX protease family)
VLDPRGAPRFPVGSGPRIAHALALAFLQPVVPVSVLVGLGSWLFDATGALRPPGLVELAAVALVPLVPNLLLLGGGLVGLGRVSPRDLGWHRPAKPLYAMVGPLAAIVAYLAVYAAVIASLADHPSAVWLTIRSYSVPSRALLLLLGLHVALYEETVFRGYLQPALVRRLGLAGGVAVTALLFAAWHPPHFHLAGFLVRLGLGLATGILRGEDRSLMAAFLAHALIWPIVGLA